MEDFSDFDPLYSVKIPFFIGVPQKAMNELDCVEIDSDQ